MLIAKESKIAINVSPLRTSQTNGSHALWIAYDRSHPACIGMHSY